MASGVSANQNCLEVFQQLKLKKKHKYIIFKLNTELTEIVVEKTSETREYEDFLQDLPESECRYAVYDFEFQKEDGGLRNKIIFLSWAPESAKIKHKMVYAASRDALKRSFTGLAVDMQGSDYGEVAHEIVLDKASRGN